MAKLRQLCPGVKLYVAQPDDEYEIEGGDMTSGVTDEKEDDGEEGPTIARAGFKEVHTASLTPKGRGTMAELVKISKGALKGRHGLQI
jgi:hypothetical protein